MIGDPISANFTPDAFGCQSNSYKYAMSTTKQQVMFSDSDGLLSICHTLVNQEPDSIANGV